MDFYTNNLKNEEKLLIQLSRNELSSNNLSYINESLDKYDIDWGYLYKILESHRVTSLIYLNLSNHFSESISESYLLKLKQHYIENTKKGLFLTSILFELLNHLNKIGIKTVYFKGPVLSYILYDDISIRQSSDLDILIDKKDFN